jgi:hypothetical protein
MQQWSVALSLRLSGCGASQLGGAMLVNCYLIGCLLSELEILFNISYDGNGVINKKQIGKNHVPQYQTSIQLRPSSYRRGDPGSFAAIRQKAFRLQPTFEGQ